jgi:ribosomal protein S12 methylthiotransferase accessory factor
MRRLHRASAEVAGAGVVLVDVTTDIGVPAYLAVTRRWGNGAQPSRWGAGASPVGEHAAACALHELIQHAAVADDDADRGALTRLPESPTLQRCLRLGLPLTAPSTCGTAPGSRSEQRTTLSRVWTQWRDASQPRHRALRL